MFSPPNVRTRAIRLIHRQEILGAHVAFPQTARKSYCTVEANIVQSTKSNSKVTAVLQRLEEAFLNVLNELLVSTSTSYRYQTRHLPSCHTTTSTSKFRYRYSARSDCVKNTRKGQIRTDCCPVNLAPQSLSSTGTRNLLSG